MTALGELSLWVALLMTVWSAGTAAVDWAFTAPELLVSSRRGLTAAAFFSGLAVCALCWALVAGQFELRYVAVHTSGRLPVVYRIAALTAGGAGSLLLWSFMLALCSAVALRRRGPVPPTLVPAVVVTLGTLLALSLAWSAIGASPFRQSFPVPADGRGLDGALQDWTRAIDTPLLVLGCAAALVWAGIAVAATTGRRNRSAWRRSAGMWPVLAFGAIGASMGVRLWWSYSHHGVLPSPAALLGGFAGAAFGAVLVLVMVVVAPTGAPGNRGGVYAATAGAVLLAVGCVAAAFGRVYTTALRDGQSFRARDAWGVDWSFASQGASRIERPAFLLTTVGFIPARQGIRRPFISAEVREFYDDLDREQHVPDLKPGIQRSITEDVSILTLDAANGNATLEIRFNPLVSCVWVGGVLMVVGGLAAAWPRGRLRVDSAA